MDLSSYKDEILLKLGGGVLDLEIDDSTLEKIINAAFREIQRYIDTTRLATIPYKSCIDLSTCGVSSVVRVFRSQGTLSASTSADSNSSLMMDPMYAAQWQMVTGVGGISNVQDWLSNYSSWTTMQQIRNTLSTDLSFRYDKHNNYLYINTSLDKPSTITIEYIPRYEDVSQIVSDYWIDKLLQLATAITKVTLGRIRSRYTQSNALWTQDGEQMLTEGNEELNTLREELKTNHNIYYPID